MKICVDLGKSSIKRGEHTKMIEQSNQSKYIAEAQDLDKPIQWEVCHLLSSLATSGENIAP